MKNKIIINKQHLQKLIEQEVSIHGNECNLNHLDVSAVTDMSEIFLISKFNGDISKWNVSNVKDMTCMFDNSSFNGDISNWDVSKVKDMNFMFLGSKFNKNLDDWKPCKLKNKDDMFENFTVLLPYWYIAENTQRAIKSYELKEKLDNNLGNKNITKIKIKL